MSQPGPSGASSQSPTSTETRSKAIAPNPALEPTLVRISLIVCGLMVLYGLAWESFIDPVRDGSWLWLKVIPLAAAIPGLARGKIYTFQWMSLLIWLYLCEALVRIASPSVSERWLALGWLILGLALCGAILLAMQRFKRQQKKQALNRLARDDLQGLQGYEASKK